MKSYIATRKRRGDSREERFHVTAHTIVEAATIASNSIDGLWEIIKVEVLR